MFHALRSGSPSPWEPGHRGQMLLNTATQLLVTFYQGLGLRFAFKSPEAGKMGCACAPCSQPCGLCHVSQTWASLHAASALSRYVKCFNIALLECVGVFMLCFPHIRTNLLCTMVVCEVLQVPVGGKGAGRAAWL